MWGRAEQLSPLELASDIPRSSALVTTYTHGTTALVAWVILTQISQRSVLRHLTAVLRDLLRASADLWHRALSSLGKDRSLVCRSHYRRNIGRLGPYIESGVP